MIKNAKEAISENRLLDAAIYYRATEFYTFKGDDPGKEYYYDKFIELFYKAIEDDEIDIIKVPYNSIDLPVMRLTPKKEKKGIIILHGGFDSFIEEFYFIMKYFSERGFEVLGFEGPGHAIDYMKIPPAIARWLMMFFIKYFRGYTSKSFKKMMKKGGRKSWELKNLMHITKKDTPIEAFEYAMKLNETNLHSELVQQNVLLLTGENNHFIPLKMHEMKKSALINVKSLTDKVFKKEKYADNHCQIGNIKLMLDTVIDWLEEK